MNFPSQEYERAVAAICDGTATETQLIALRTLLGSDAQALDDYLWKVELHARLASEPALFIGTEATGEPEKIILLPTARRWKAIAAAVASMAGIAACILFFVNQQRPLPNPPANRTVTAQPNGLSAQKPDVIALNMRLESLRTRLAISAERIRILEMSGLSGTEGREP